MNENSNLIIKNMYNSMSEEIIELFNKIDYNFDLIIEYESYIDKLNIEVEDIDIFSPKIKNTQLLDEIKHNKEKVSELNIENKNILDIIDGKKKYIYQIECILAEESIKLENNKNQFSKEIAMHIIQYQEMERQRIARDLHDITLQNLTHIIHKLEFCNVCI